MTTRLTFTKKILQEAGWTFSTREDVEISNDSSTITIKAIFTKNGFTFISYASDDLVLDRYNSDYAYTAGLLDLEHTLSK